MDSKEENQFLLAELKEQMAKINESLNNITGWLRDISYEVMKFTEYMEEKQDETQEVSMSVDREDVARQLREAGFHQILENHNF